MRLQTYSELAQWAGCFVAGAAAGGAAVLLFTPLAGREVRGKLRSEAVARTARGRRVVSEAIEVGREAYQESVQERF